KQALTSLLHSNTLTWREDPIRLGYFPIYAFLTDHPERTKTDLLHSSLGPLSSIRAAIKRTRTNSQADHNRDRRRPEITILSAEPLASNNWFPGSPVVIKQKTQEVVKPIAAPRRSACATSTSSSATQTANTGCPITSHTAAPKSKEKTSADKKTQKPARPSLPKSAHREPSAKISAPTKVGTFTDGANQSGSKLDVKQLHQADSTRICTRSVTVHWKVAPPAETSPPSPEPQHNQCPVPLPRIKSFKLPITEEVKVQTLVRLSENCDNLQVDSCNESEEASSGRYLKELLEVFSPENCSEQDCDVNQSDDGTQGDDATEEMSVNNTQHSFRARIQAFESQATIDEDDGVEADKALEPSPRKVTNKPPVSAKPSLAFKPQFNNNIDDVYEEVTPFNMVQVPTPSPRPQVPKKPASQQLNDQLETPPAKVAIPLRSLPPVLTRAKTLPEKPPTTAPLNPFKEALKPNLNINNHNSTSMAKENEYVDSPFDHFPIKPQHSLDSSGDSLRRQSMTRRPTTIRVPSQTGIGNVQDRPPPLPAQRPVGALDPSMSHKQSLPSTLPSWDSFDLPQALPLPPRPGTVKTLPPRPPPAKAGPGRPPAPKLGGAGRSLSVPVVQWEVAPKPQTQRPQKKGPVLPPRPKPGQRLYNKYTLQLPHGIAAYDYSGLTGELSFQKNEVLLLLEEIDHNTFKCQAGDTTGRVPKSYITVITPLAASSVMSPPQDPADSSRDGNGMKVQAVHDFTPGGPGELGLRAGDMVSMVEQVDNDWYKGTCGGQAGFFPISHVKILSNSPKPVPDRKGKSSTVSGPRCVARFDFEGEHSDELPFSEGDVIQLKAYLGKEWARGQLGVYTGIFPVKFVDIIEDLPPRQQQTQPTRITKIALPGMTAQTSSPTKTTKPVQAPQPSVEWVVALYDFVGNTDDDLSFQQGDNIQLIQHLNDEWCQGKLNGREGTFPTAFVESSTVSSHTGQTSSKSQQNSTNGGGKAKALFNFTADCDEELSLRVGDIITNLESVDEEWFLADSRGIRGLVPKNYVQELG
ncbi:SH3 domain-containing protein 19, partial [Genypterus blacodes]|uniref:SH3 domain-containing protein 19 n=1 Tax=Genypterus blacodes TaxID=154954 RepID=UPI003F776B89